MTKLLLVATVADTLRAFFTPWTQYFRALGWQVDGMASGISRCHVCTAAFNRVWEASWSRNPLSIGNFARAPYEVKRVVECECYDLVHVHTPVAAFVTRYALREPRTRGGPRLIYTAHGFHFHPLASQVLNRCYIALERTAGRWTDYLVVINTDDHEAALKYGLVPPGRLRRIPGVGVDTETLKPGSIRNEQIRRVQRELGVTADQPVFLMIAEFTPNKRHKNLLGALARLPLKDAQVAFAGTGPAIGRVKRLANTLGLSDRVRFLGYRNDVPCLISASTAVVLASIREGLPRSIMESLSLEVPVIGTNIRGIRDLLKEGSGILVDVDDIDDLTEAMRWVVMHPDEAKRMARGGRQKVKAECDLETVLRSYHNLYVEALERDNVK